jgi:xylan 1,4-beta-xylosidase
MSRIFTLTSFLLLSINLGFGQSASFQTYMNPVIPGDHPDCTLTKVGNDYYTTGSSFNPTPVIYHSTDLVHWEAIAQPVSAAWANYDTKPAGGCWGGQVIYHEGKWWDFFGMRFTMYFVTANDVRGPWSQPTAMICPSSVPGLGADNSIFVENDSTWYLLVKNGQPNNWILQLGNNGQPSGKILNLTWLNPGPSYPYSWAEGPVMWEYQGYYYYSFARDVAGGQYFMRSKTLTDSASAWTTPASLFNVNDPLASSAVFGKPNHASAAVMLDDSTSWVLHPVWRTANNNEWAGQGRQGLLNQVRYDTNGIPTADYPDNISRPAPKLPSSGIPWMVPHSDFFTSTTMDPEWSYLGYTPDNTHSLTTRPGWLTLSKRSDDTNTVIKNDGEHNYSIITRLDFSAQTIDNKAGIWIFNGLQSLHAELYSSLDGSSNRIVGFSYKTTSYTVASPSGDTTSVVWLKLVRVNHMLSGYCSADGYNWIQVGSSINVADMDAMTSDWNNGWSGIRQGLFVIGGVPANFDFYIYRDAYTPILAECPANQYGTTASAKVNGISSLDNIQDGDWALYAGVEFGDSTEYVKAPDSLKIIASCGSTGGTVEVWLDSLDTGTKIAECNITGTGSWSTYDTFTTKVLAPVSGNHDVYLRFKGTGSSKLFMLQWLSFTNKYHSEKTTDVGSASGQLPRRFELKQNFPNPFNPTTMIDYQLPKNSNVTLKVYDVLGREVSTLVNQKQGAGVYNVAFNANNLPSGVYFYRVTAGSFSDTKKLLLLK